MEEPENGIHPERMQAMVELVRGLAVDPSHAPGADNPFRQVIVNTHSPLFVQLQHAADRLFARQVLLTDEDGLRSSALRLRPERGTWRDPDGSQGVGVGEMLSYLADPAGVRLSVVG
jgi:predicted ATPase